MANNYAKIHAQDQGGTVLPQYPSPFLALEEWYTDNGSTSSILNISHDTTVVEVAALGGAAAIKWVPSTDTAATSSVITTAGATANFDHVIASNTVRRFVLPVDTTLTVAPQSIQGVNRLNGLIQKVAWKTFGVASITLTEY